MTELNIPLEKLIASKAIIGQCKKEKRIFTPFEQAVLIYQNPLLSHDEMLNLLNQIDETIKGDSEYKELHKQLEERILTKDENQIEWFHKEHFANAFIEVPFPFRNGDFVHTIGDSKISIFSSCKDEKDYKKGIKFRQNLLKKGAGLDTTDISCRVESLEPSYKNPQQLCFQHYHPSLLTLEYAELKEDDENYVLLKTAQELMQGSGSLEVFCESLLK